MKMLQKYLIFFSLFYFLINFAYANSNYSTQIQTEDIVFQALSYIQKSEIQKSIDFLQDKKKTLGNIPVLNYLLAELYIVKSGMSNIRDLTSSLDEKINLFLITQQVKEIKTLIEFNKDKNLIQNLTNNILQLGLDFHNVVLVDIKTNYLYVLSRSIANKPSNSLAKSYKMVYKIKATLGKIKGDKQKENDKKTPFGVYHITRWIKGRKLPDKYGYGAYPISYPNKFDISLNKTGYGIWIHGVPFKSDYRGERDTEGCVALTNQGLEQVRDIIGNEYKTPVIILDSGFKSKISTLDTNILQKIKKQYLNIAYINTDKLNIFKYPNKNLVYVSFINTKGKLVENYWIVKDNNIKLLL